MPILLLCSSIELLAPPAKCLDEGFSHTPWATAENAFLPLESGHDLNALVGDFELPDVLGVIAPTQFEHQKGLVDGAFDLDVAQQKVGIDHEGDVVIPLLAA